MHSFEKWLRIILPEMQLLDYVKQHGFIKKQKRVSPQVESKLEITSARNFVSGSQVRSSTVASSPVSTEGLKEVAKDAKKGITNLRTKTSNENIDNIFEQIKYYLNEHIQEQAMFIDQLATTYKGSFLNRKKGVIQQVLLLAGLKGTGKTLSLSLLIEQLYLHRLIPYRKLIEIDLSVYNEKEIQTNFIADCAAAFEYGIGTVLFKGIQKAHPDIIQYIALLVGKGFFRTEAGITIEASDYFIVFSVDEDVANYEVAKEILPKSIRNEVKATALSQSLSMKLLESIARKRLQYINNELVKNAQYSIQFTADVPIFLGENAIKTKEYGTALHKWIESDIHSALINLRASGAIKQGDKISLAIADGIVVARLQNKIYPVLRLSSEESLEELLKELEELTGLYSVKSFVKELIDTVKIQSIRKQAGQKKVPMALHMIFSGNPGTGKTTVARLIGRILKAMGILSQGQLIETARQDLVGQYLGSTAPKTNQKIQEAIGGVLFIDEAYTLSRDKNDPFGQEAIDTLVKGMEDFRDNLVVILAGYTNEMNDFLKANPGLPSRFPFQVEFPDYSPEEMFEITEMFALKRDYKIDRDIKAELVELFTRKQVPGRNDSGNGRLSRNILEEAIRRQSVRLMEIGGNKLDLNLLQREDFGITEEQTFNLEEKLGTVIGLDHVKTFLRTLEKQILVNKRRKEAGIEVNTEQTLNMIFFGNPGTGKTTLARYVAEMLKHLGVIKRGHLVEVGKTELVSGYVGQTAQKTKEVVESALGGVLFIDEAYALADKNQGGIGEEAIHELVRLIEIHKDNLVVILAGYTDEMRNFLRVNPGLASRFPFQTEFPDYSAEEMVRITELMAVSKGFRLEKGITNLLKDWYESKQIVGRKDIGNGRLVRNVLEEAIRRQAVRIVDKVELANEELTLLTSLDFNLNEKEVKQTALKELEKVIGLDQVKSFVQSLSAQIEMNNRRKELGLPISDGQTLHMVFKGNPGTGKTTIARIIAKRLKELNVIKTDILVETDRSGLVAGYVGQTALKTKEVIDRALGGLLFIDEAYSLSTDSFGKEAIDTLVKAMEDYKNELVVIVAGYEDDMEEFLRINPGLRSRFPNIITFLDYNLDELLKMSQLIFQNKGYRASESAEEIMLELFKAQVGKEDSGNGRFVRNLCENAIRQHAVRYSGKVNASVEELTTIEAEDISKEVKVL